MIDFRCFNYRVIHNSTLKTKSTQSCLNYFNNTSENDDIKGPPQSSVTNYAALQTDHNFMKNVDLSKVQRIQKMTKEKKGM